ncbi:hypothetical protein O3M35_011645 [Rhynocoris fuscipes]|uniref:Major facilitator superfamily (MFS) profile domain-containing protein n=1 Tax=Rhynocoris fuscipes TaxID=488301 RepID=A0AAW1CZM4_9HEMI
MGFFALANGYIQRFCLSLAITEMVATHKLHPSKIDPYACPLDTVITTNGTVHKFGGEFAWDESTQGLILSAFFWGYVVMQLPGGLLAEKFGGKYTLEAGMLTSTICTLLTPFVARAGGAIGLTILRFVLGLGQGPLYPSLNVLMAHWAPPLERGRMGALIFAGAMIGNVISMALSGFLIYHGGWTTVFYVFGFLGLCWAILWQLLITSDPSDHPYISEKELKYIKETTGRTKNKDDIPPTPWKSILTSVPLWGLIIAQIGHDWGLFTIITDLPKYMKSVMHFSITQNGLLSAAPYLVMWLFAIISGWIVDWLVKKGFSVSVVRKIFISIASVGPAVGIIAASYSGCDKVMVASFFALGMGSMGAFVPSLKVNALDLSPNYAGTLMALVAGIGAISGIITPYLVGLLTPNSTLLEWRLVFWIAVAVLCATNLIYLVMGSAEVQPWNSPTVSRQELDEENHKSPDYDEDKTSPL